MQLAVIQKNTLCAKVCMINYLKVQKFYFINCHYLVDKENIKIEKRLN